MTRADRRLATDARRAWLARGLGVLSTFTPLADPWGGSRLDLLHVPAHAWTDNPAAFPGAREVLVSWPAGKLWNAKAWSRAWNQAFGFPRYGPPWTWTWQPGQGNTAVLWGRPFDLTGDADGRLWLPYDQIDYAGHPRQVVCGLGEDGLAVLHDLDTTPHALAAGATGSGKTKAIHARLFHLLAADVLSGLVILDWKRKDFKVFTHRAWDAGSCRGVTVAKPDLDPKGIPTTLDAMVDAAEAVLAELGRRMLASEELDEDEDPWADELVLLVFDEVLATLAPEAKPPADDKSEQANQIRTRNRQRARLGHILTQVVLLGRALRVYALLGASSPRAEFLDGEAKAAVQHRVYLGQFQDVAEPVVVFGRDAPASPPPWPGYGVWRILRADADPAEPYLYFKAYWVPTGWLDVMLDNRVLPAADWQPGSSPWCRDYDLAA